MKALRKLAPALGVTVTYLETGTDHPETERLALELYDYELALRLGETPPDFVARLGAIAERATLTGHTRIATRARLALGVHAAHGGDHAQAVALLTEAISEPWLSPVADPDIYTTLGHSLAAIGQPEKCIALCRACIQKLEQTTPTPHNTIVRFATFLSYAATEFGDDEATNDALALAVLHGEKSRDPYTRVRLHWARARAAAETDDLDLARRSIDQAITLLSDTEDLTYLARAHLLASEITLKAEDYERTSYHLDQAESTLPKGACLGDQAYLLYQHAFYAARTGDPQAALDNATRAVALLGDKDDPAVRGEAHWALAEAYSAAGAHAAARAAFTQASDLIPPGHRNAKHLLQAWHRATTLANDT